MSATAAASENNVEVRFVDQEKINRFGQLNNRMMELKADIKQMKGETIKIHFLYIFKMYDKLSFVNMFPVLLYLMCFMPFYKNAIRRY